MGISDFREEIIVQTPADPKTSILIVGGGTAGWMAASLFAQRWPATKVSVIESPEIGIIGVGEGSTPQLKAFFQKLGVAETEWMARCNATYKNGISFHGWSDAPGCGSYFHPFPSTIDAHTSPAFNYNSHMRRRGIDLEARPDRFFLSARLAANSLAPIANRNFPFEMAYGYHFDAALVGAFLRDRAVAAGVTHLQGKATRVVLDPDGAISSLQLEDGRVLHAGFFVDATGFRSLMLQEALGVPFKSFKENLFNDAAVTIASPRSPSRLGSQTRSIAMKHGWRWEIPLTNRTGNGYVYSSDYCSAEDAEKELRTALGPDGDDAPARRLTMKVGRVEKHWTRNCLAVGLSQGFIEPLEATALHLIQATIEGFIEQFESGGFTNAGEERFNADINARFEGVRDYIVCHYRMSKRADTQYWRDNAANERLSDSLRSLLTCWFSGGDMREEVRRQNIARYYAETSWLAMLGGYGRYPDGLRPPTAAERRFVMSIIDDFIERCALNFRAHGDVIEDRREPGALQAAQ